MINDLTYLGSLLGRVFLISKTENLNEWNGNEENLNGESDYDLISNFISYEEGDLSIFNKSINLSLLIYFSMSSKVEIFSKTNSLILCDGLYFNNSLNNLRQIKLKLIEELEFKTRIENNELVIFDAAIEGKRVLENTNEGVFKIINDDFNSGSLINLTNGIYSTKRIEVNIIFDNQEVSLKGIEISL